MAEEAPRSVLDRMERSSKAMGDLDRAGELTIKYHRSLSDRKLVERAEASEAAVAAALKALTSPGGPLSRPSVRHGPSAFPILLLLRGEGGRSSANACLPSR